MYEKTRELVQISTQSWLSKEVFSLGWFVMMVVLIIVYTVWLKLADRSRGTELLLIGSLAAVAYILHAIILGHTIGLAEYIIRPFPIFPPVFEMGATLAPIAVMLVEQYTHSWKGYLVRSAAGFAFISFVLAPVYLLLGIFRFHNWNVFFFFLVLYVISILVRLVFLWITDTKKRILAKQK